MLGAEFRVSREIDFSQLDSSKVAMPRYGFGYIAAFPIARNSLQLFGPNGQLIYHSELIDSRGVQLKIVDVAIAPSGRVAVAATALGADGKTEAVLAFLSPSGVIGPLLPHESFVPLRLRFRSEGELWAVGFSRVESGGHVIRVYDSSGKTLRSLLPNSDFPGVRHLHVDGILAPSQVGMAVFLPRVRSLSVYESLDVAPVQYRNLPIPADWEVLTASMVESSKLLLQCLVPSSDASINAVAPRVFQLDLLHLREGLQPLESEGDKSPAIIGSKAGELVRIRGGRVLIGSF
jgi:hypothetical protein